MCLNALDVRPFDFFFVRQRFHSMTLTVDFPHFDILMIDVSLFRVFTFVIFVDRHDYLSTFFHIHLSTFFSFDIFLFAQEQVNPDSAYV